MHTYMYTYIYIYVYTYNSYDDNNCISATTGAGSPRQGGER